MVHEILPNHTRLISPNLFPYIAFFRFRLYTPHSRKHRHEHEYRYGHKYDTVAQANSEKL